MSFKAKLQVAGLVLVLSALGVVGIGSLGYLARKAEIAREAEAKAQRAELRRKEAERVANLTPEERKAEEDAHAAAIAAQEKKAAEIAEKKANDELAYQGRMAIYAAKRKVPLSLKDPDSARFGAVKATVSKDGVISVCGLVNAKNSYGGYTGETEFFHAAGMTVIRGAVDDSGFVKMWKELCVEQRLIAAES